MQLWINVFRPSSTQPHAEFLLESAPSGDESVELTNLDHQDFLVLKMLTELESFRVSRAMGALAHAMYSRGLRDARKKLTTA